MKALRNVWNATLSLIPYLEELTLRLAFKRINSVEAIDASEFEKSDELAEMIRKTRENREMEAKKKPTIRNLEDWNRIDNCVEELIIKAHFVNSEVTEIKLNAYQKLRVFIVGDYSFEGVMQLKVDGLNELEELTIGKHCCVKRLRNSATTTEEQCFLLKKCPKLRELKIGSESLKYYSKCKIEDLRLLETIEIGVLNEQSDNFISASLELSGNGWEQATRNRIAFSQVAQVRCVCIPRLFSHCVSG